MPQATGEFENQSWNEEAFDEREDAGKLTHASVTQRFSGAIDATATIGWLMAYRPDGTARFVGMQRMDGSVDGRKGTFVVESIGDFTDGVAKGALRVVPGSGTGDLTGLTGQGTFEAPMGPNGKYVLDYTVG
jgi:hypothetical protein